MARPRKEKVKCSVDDCEKFAVCKGYCMAHYTRLKDYGRLHRVLGSNEGKKCSVEGCEKPAQSLGYCKAHYQKKVVYGERGKIRSRGHPLYSLWHERKIRNVLSVEWLNFKTFLKDVGDRPSKFHALVRLREGNYGSDNFEWRKHLKREPGETIKAWHARKWQARKQANPGWDNDRRISKKYGITRKEYNEKNAAQGGICGICKQPETRISHHSGTLQNLAIDHCHLSGKNRELLCWRCNTVIGQVEENTELLDAMKEYILRHRSTT